jgi:hypothetical protein
LHETAKIGIADFVVIEEIFQRIAFEFIPPPRAATLNGLLHCAAFGAICLNP